MKSIVRQVAIIAAWVLAVLIAVLSVVPVWLRPETRTPHYFEHFAIFAITGVAFGLGYSRRPLLLMAALVIYAGTIELAQLFAPGRHARLSDFIVDALALCAGVGAAFIAARTRPQRS